jgi:diguanylate cyclase (GGDEF)-like protein/PAS domain S-box-containing protein
MAFGGLKTQLLAPILAAVALGMAVTSLFTFWNTAKVADEAITSQGQMVVSSLKRNLSEIVSDIRSMLRRMDSQRILTDTLRADAKDASRTGRLQRTNEILDNHKLLCPYYQTFALLDRNGTPVASSYRSEIGQLGKYESADYFIKARDGQETVSNLLFLPVNNQPGLVVAVPVRKDGVGPVIGVLCVTINLIPLNTILVPSFQSENRHYALIVNHSGQVVAFPDSRYIGETIYNIVKSQGDEGEWWRQVRTTHEGKINYLWKGEQRRLYYETCEIATGVFWIIGASAPADDLLAPVRQARMMALLCMSATLLAVGLVVFWVVGWIVGDLQLETAFAKRVADGDLDAESRPMRRQDEIGEMNVAVRKMVQRLRAMLSEADAGRRNIREMSDTLPLAVFQALEDAEGNIVYTFVGAKIRQLMGLESEQLIRDSRLLFTVVHPDDRESLKTTISQIPASNVRTYAQFRVIVNGEIRWIQSEAVPATDGEEGRHWNGYWQDISSQKRFEASLVKEAATDPLTGILNRREFLASSKREFDRARRYHSAMSVIMLDIDHFKKINDTYGHAIGDEILLSLVAMVQKLLRSPDIFGRLGGEEFAVVLPATDLAGGATVAGRLREAAESLCYHLDGETQVVFTISLGVASWRPGDSGMEELLERADAALYVAKESGRNRVCLEE